MTRKEILDNAAECVCGEHIISGPLSVTDGGPEIFLIFL